MKLNLSGRAKRLVMVLGCLVIAAAFAVETHAVDAAALLQKNSAGRSAEPQKARGKAPKKLLTDSERRAMLRAAQLWVPTDVRTMDIKLGPVGSGAFAPNALVACDYVDTRLAGSSRKFNCRVGDDDVVKVRYGANNGEVEGSVLGSRLLWALGFGADRVYPVRVNCRGCSTDPWTMHERAAGEQLFDPAVIERKPPGREVAAEPEGWAWPELALVDEAQGGASLAQRDALTLLAVFMQHTDSKAEQQRLLCLSGEKSTEGVCDKPFLTVHDVGLTFGHANFSNWTDTGSVNLVEWMNTPVWRDAEKCVGHLSKSRTGTLNNPKIHEAGRAFLADLMVQLSDEQLHDLFEVARVDVRSRKPSSHRAAPPGTVDEWVSAFKHKRDAIVTNHCPA